MGFIIISESASVIYSLGPLLISFCLLLFLHNNTAFSNLLSYLFLTLILRNLFYNERQRWIHVGWMTKKI